MYFITIGGSYYAGQTRDGVLILSDNFDHAITMHSPGTAAIVIGQLEQDMQCGRTDYTDKIKLWWQEVN